MKITGRNIKRRLYGLSQLPNNIKRARFWRGHGVHSPYVYSIVRQVFMSRCIKGNHCDLMEILLDKGIAKKRAIELQNLVAHCKYNTYAIDITPQQMEGFDFVISTLQAGNEILNSLAKRAEELGSTLCIISPSYDFARNKVCKALVEAHPCTSIDNRGYLLLFNNHLPKQIFEL